MESDLTIKQRIQRFLINRIGPFLVKYYKKDFEELILWAEKLQCDMLKEQIEAAAKKGVNMVIQLDPTIVPMGMQLFHLHEEEKKNPFSVVEDNEDDN